MHAKITCCLGEVCESLCECYQYARSKLLNFGCGTNRRHKGLSLFKIPRKDATEYAEWRSQLLGKILRDREMDAGLKKQIEMGSLHVCEKHFTDDCIETCKCKHL